MATSAEQDHPLAILEEAMNAGRVPQEMREQYRRRLSTAIYLEVGEAMSLTRHEPVPHVCAGIEGFEEGS